MTIIAIFEDGVTLALDQNQELVTNLPEGALDLIQDEQLLLTCLETADIGPVVGEELFHLI